MSNFFCAAPWRGLHINPRGDVKTCCAGDPNMLGNLNTQTIEQILHGPVMQEIRQSIRQGEPHSYCYNCVQAERYGRSERDWHNNVSPEFDCAQALDTEHVPTLIDVRWNTTCNLSCNYCAEACSSKWAALKGIPVKSGARPYYESVCDYLEQHQHNIREVALVGGEPLLLPENERLLDVIPEDCVVTLITNVAVDFETNKIFRKLCTRERVGWSLSFDNIGDRFEYVRYGASWQQLLANIIQIRRLMSTKHHWGGIHAVYNIYNATHLVDITQFARDNDLSIQWQSLYQPEYLDPTRLGGHVASGARNELEKLLATDLCTDSERQFFENVLTNMQPRDDLGSQFAQHIHDIENKYHVGTHLKFAKLWPELSYLLPNE
jgi:sulfatase maturation enzyme AslB (radical SAM superfamily)